MAFDKRPDTRDQPPGQHNLARLVEQVAQAGTGDGVSLRAVVDTLGPRSFGPMLLVPALAIVSPASTIPMVPTILAVAIGLIALQIILQRDKVWLPRALLDKRLSEARFQQVLRFLRGVARRADPFINERLTVLTDRPGNLGALLICCVVALAMPVLELVPFMTSFVATALALFAVGLLFRDGVMMLAGYALVACGGALLYQLSEGLAAWLGG